MPSATLRRTPLLWLLALTACGSSNDATRDAGPAESGVPDAGMADGSTGDGGGDAGMDDAGMDDAGADAGTAAGGADAGMDPGPWTAIVAGPAETAATLRFGEGSLAGRGTADEWIPILAATETAGAIAWAAGIGFSGTLPASGPNPSTVRVAIEPVSRDVYVLFSVQVGETPMTLELSGPDGTVGASSATFADASALGVAYFEPFLAKLDADGQPRWLKRLAQGTGDFECTSTLGFAVNAEGTRVMVALNTNNVGDRTSGSSAQITLGPGDLDERVGNVPTNQRINVTMLLEPATGALVDATAIGDRTANYGGVNSGWGLPSATMIYDEVGGRYGVAGGISNFQVTDVVFGLGSAMPISVPQPGAQGYRALYGIYTAAGLDVRLGQAAAGNVASDATTFSYPLLDGGLLVAATLASTTNATFSSGSGPRVFAGGQDDTGWLALYAADAELVWAKPALAGAANASLVWRSAVDDPADEAIFAWGLLFGSTGVTLGAGEPGEVTLGPVNASLQHGVLARFERSTGELTWARLVEQTSNAPAVNLVGTLFRGEAATLEIRHTASGEVTVAGRAEDFGPGVSWVRTVVAEDGTLVGTDALLRPTEEGSIRALVSDLSP